MLRKQKEPVGEQGLGLTSETRNLLHYARGQKTRPEGLPCCPALHTFTARHPEHLRETRGQEEQEMVQGRWVRVQPSAPPEDWSGATQAASAFPIFVQHMPANDGAHAYNELTWRPTEMHFKEAVVLYELLSPFIKEMLSTWATQHRVIPQDWKGLIGVSYARKWSTITHYHTRK